MKAKRKNVKVERVPAGFYRLYARERCVVAIMADQWKDLGLKPLRKGQTATIDLQVSGLPKKRGGKGKK